MEFAHKSVLLDETIEGLNIREGKIYLDGTLGGAGHSREILKKTKGDWTFNWNRSRYRSPWSGKRKTFRL